MKTVEVYAPEGSEKPGEEHTIPEADLKGFLENGWTEAKEKSNKNK